MKLSIITINYNNANGLEKTIRSVINQNYKDFEYIVIDGKSSDGSVEVIEKYASHINYWISEQDAGIYNAMNKGIQQAKGEYLLFINSGDFLAEDADLSKITENITGEDLVYFNLRLFFNTGEIKVKSYPDFLDFKYFSIESLPHPATFIKKQLFLNLGLYDECMKICADWAFFVRAICLGSSTYKHVNESFSVFCLDGMSSDKENQQRIFAEKLAYIELNFKLYVSLFRDWYDQKLELTKIKREPVFRVLKKVGFFKWIK